MNGDYARTEAVKALDNNDGNVELAIQELQRKAFAPLIDRIKDSCVQDNEVDDVDLRLGAGASSSNSLEEDIFAALVSKKDTDINVSEYM